MAYEEWKATAITTTGLLSESGKEFAHHDAADMGFDGIVTHCDGGWVGIGTGWQSTADDWQFYVIVERQDQFFETLEEAQAFLWEHHSQYEAQFATPKQEA
jgi:hypothetical protein